MVRYFCRLVVGSFSCEISIGRQQLLIGRDDSNGLLIGRLVGCVRSCHPSAGLSDLLWSFGVGRLFGYLLAVGRSVDWLVNWSVDWLANRCIVAFGEVVVVGRWVLW